jgi:uncharacterized protein YegL
MGLVSKLKATGAGTPVTPAQAGAPQAPSPTFTFSRQVIEARLKETIKVNKLEAFYKDPQQLDTLFNRVSQIKLDPIAQQWKLPKELIFDLISLSLYDIVLYCDDSGSMRMEQGGRRIEEMKNILSKITSIATLFDDDGIQVTFMNSILTQAGVKTESDVIKLVNQVDFNGYTPIGTHLKDKVFKPLIKEPAKQKKLKKPVLIIVITDGEPNGEPYTTINKVLDKAHKDLKKTIYGVGAMAVQIVQVGNDTKAQEFLNKLDNDSVIGKIVDVTSHYELEYADFLKKGITLSPEIWLLKICVGAIDPTYDGMD